jgi:hypothetical protein
MLLVLSKSAPLSVNWDHRNHHQSKTESVNSTNLNLLFRWGYIEFGGCLCSMDEILICFSFVFDRWTTTPMPHSKPTDSFIAIGCTIPVSPCYSETCCTALATWGLPRTMAVHAISSGVHAVRSMWTSRLTPLTRP